MSITTGILVTCIALFLLSRKRDKPTARAKLRRLAHRSQARPVNPYASASVRTRDCSCAEAKALGSRRFLSSDVPQLPLPACSAASCGCRYSRHEDRRRPDDRRALYSLQADLYSVSGDADRRFSSAGRRATDVNNSADLEEIDYDNIEWTS